MKNKITRLQALILALSMLFVLFFFTGCDSQGPNAKKINGVSIEKYTIVYSEDDVDYSKRAAEYIASEIQARTAVALPVVEASEGTFVHEIVVGETSRQISQDLDADTVKTQFATLADGKHIALEGDYFLIAAAAYYFVETYIPGENFNSKVPKKVSIHEPITKEAKNFIMLIGDGMGYTQTQLFDIMDSLTSITKPSSDNEDSFYGYLLPYEGASMTDSLTGVTDSAAGGTALASGYKTHNKYVGKDASGQDVVTLTELASSLGKATAVMSTESSTGATPASFSAHTLDRTNRTEIAASQEQTKSELGTIICCDYDYYDRKNLPRVETAITQTLNTLSENENGFFLMYEEAHIDKHSHDNDLAKTFDALVRFNQAIGLFMEYAFYHPDTFVLITADHETGDLRVDDRGVYRYNRDGHTGQDVPVFAYGAGAEVFDGMTIENVQIPKTIATMMGEYEFGDPAYASLIYKE